MSKTTINRLREIIEEINLAELGYSGRRVAAKIVNHPEIKSLFEDVDQIVACYGQCSDCPAIYQSETCEEMQELRSDEIRKAEPVEVSEIKSYAECDTIHFGVCPTCRGTVTPDNHKTKCSCGQKLIWPNEELKGATK